MFGELGTGSLIAGISLLTLALFHSWLGERHLIGPLLASPSLPAFALGNTFAKSVLRLAWHLTSLAWLAFAYLMFAGQVAPLPVAVFLAASGTLTYAATRGRHFAWAVFMLGALGAASASGVSDQWHTCVAAVGGAVLAAIGGIHVGWAFGLRWGFIAALPEKAGRPLFTPSPAASLLVAGALFTAAWLTLALGGLVPAPVPRAWLWPDGIAAAVVFGARAIGDLRYVGLFKRVRGSTFARQDDVLFTPLCFALCAAILLQL
ncbi:MAG TPA: DUF3995 domain-containing protein [Polyangiales bacterium]|nr:DUF3995 domain-containing protein [Polyangiales bacterium]